VRYGTAKEIANPTKEVDCLQRDFELPSLCSSNARHVIETMKGNANLDANSSTGIIPFHLFFYICIRSYYITAVILCDLVI